MDDFLRFFDKVRSRIPMHIEIGYSSVVDWMIVIYEGRLRNGWRRRKRNRTWSR